MAPRALRAPRLLLCYPVRGLDLVERAVEHLVAAKDHEDPIAHLLGGRHVVRAEDDRRPGSLQLQHRIFQYLGVHRIEAGERLVEDQQVGPADDRGDELRFLRHAFRERVDPLVAVRRQVEARQPALDERVELGSRSVLQPAEVLKQTAKLHLLVQPALFREIADAIARRTRRRVAEHSDLTAVRQQDVQDHPQRRRLAGSVGTDESVRRRGGNAQRQVVDGARLAEGLGHSSNLDGVHLNL